MCDFDDFGEDFEDDGFMDEGSFEEPFEPHYDDHDDPNDDIIGEADSDGPAEAPMTDISNGLDWEDIAFLGGMSEEIAEEKRRRDKIRRDMSRDD